MTEFLTIAAAADLIAARRLSPVELTAGLVARAEAIDPQINAYLRPCFDAAMDQARAAEAAIMADGPRGALHGIPYGLKDVYDAAGLPTTGHSRCYADYVPEEDAATTASLGAAGAVLLGKLSTHEGAHGGPSFDLAWPPARNPWNREHFTGGSSSGSGAAVAAGLMPFALGTDTGGSIRNPAALCGLVGLKPSYGLVSRRGVMPNSFSYDHAGPMTWTVEDCAIVLQAIAGHDPRDPGSASRPIPDYRAALTGDIRGLRIGVLRHVFEEDTKPAPATKAALEAAFDVLRGLGAVLEDARIRPMGEYFDVKVVAAESEIFSVHEKALRERPNDFGEDFLARILPAVMIRGTDYVAAQRLRRVMLAEFEALYARYDVLVTAAPSIAPRLDAWRPIHFWRSHSSLVTAFNVSAGPALVQCIGYEQGLPIAMQIVGRPFDETMVLRVADAYERATPWRATRPMLDPKAEFSTALPPVPDPEPVTIGQAEQDELRLLCARAGVTKLNDRNFRHLCSAAPLMRAMLDRLQRPARFADEPVNVFQYLG
ncbi:aspartyl-tRNA(Asn)/glutamyl-tRNA(Gln) amidotransferase subunit A [Humitalea rosea]|uniref:Aspartyl-tRNA(Asn)/glutamyl-tRNA(Gln) amidotransferase subunit A n=1 Tax=Humitalea rosea TaxID=990373 RepID=A0A2W7IN54_9PROT|nr:amidase [Humitalea rosea]PZW40797.1 aspartyl-tRNA(Asn)/glutamyl-tRNA(Gln) amidotransferase subunit A [Humitalea rosea]